MPCGIARYTPVHGLDISVVAHADRFRVNVELLSSFPSSSTHSIMSIGSSHVPDMDKGVEAETCIAGHRWGSLS